MKADTRLAKVERHLSPRQLVTIQVVESRTKYRSFVESGQALARTGIQRPTLMELIAESVRATNPGADRMLRHRLIREAQREGMFLARLSNEVAVQVVEEETELNLRTALFAAHLGLMMSQKEPPKEEHLEFWLNGALDHWRRLLYLQAAARRISEAYFDDAKVLYAETEECLAENLAGIEKVLAMAVGQREVKGAAPQEGMDLREMAPTPEEVAEAADEIATAWVINTQGAVAAEFGEDDRAVRLLGSLLLR